MPLIYKVVLSVDEWLKVLEGGSEALAKQLEKQQPGLVAALKKRHDDQQKGDSSQK